MSLRRARPRRARPRRATTSRPRRTSVLAVVVIAVAAGSCACAPATDPPEPAVLRTTAPPWDAPRDAVAYIDAAGADRLPFGHPVEETVKAHLEVVVGGEPVTVPAFVGIDRVRAVEAALHTHADDGVLWVESPSRGTEHTVGDFFDLWGVRLDERCLGATCADAPGEGPVLTVDGRRHDGDPRDVVLRDGQRLVLEDRR